MYDKDASKQAGSEQKGNEGASRQGGGQGGFQQRGQQGSTGSQQAGQGAQRSGTQLQGKFFVNNKPVENVTESRPTVRSILKAAGEDVENVTVYKLSGKEDTQGTEIGLDETCEATGGGCYLRTEREEETSDRSLGVSDIKSGAGGQRTGGGSGGNAGGSNPGGGQNRGASGGPQGTTQQQSSNPNAKNVGQGGSTTKRDATSSSGDTGEQKRSGDESTESAA